MDYEEIKEEFKREKTGLIVGIIGTLIFGAFILVAIWKLINLYISLN